MLAIRFTYVPENGIVETSEIELNALTLIDLFDKEIHDCDTYDRLPMAVMFSVDIHHYTENTTMVEVNAGLCSMSNTIGMTYAPTVNEKTAYFRRFRNIEELKISINGGDYNGDEIPYAMKLMNEMGEIIDSCDGSTMSYTGLKGDCFINHCSNGLSLSSWYTADSDCYPEIDSESATEIVSRVVISSFIRV